MNKAAFYKVVRARLGVLEQGQVNGFEAVMDAVDGAPLAHQAYMLATAWHETAHTMQPMRELGGRTYFMRMYDVTGQRPQLAITHGNTTPGDGARYYGRGYVQLTWKDNYARVGQKMSVDLVTYPDLALNSDLAAQIMRRGMDEGWFSGKKNSDYLPMQGVATRSQYMAARRIINGVDKADLIEDYAQVFERGLRDAGIV